jgi:hypothetical protein
MIQIRKNVFSDTSIEIEFKDKETLEELLQRALVLAEYGEDKRLKDHFQILVNGLKVDKEFWPITITNEKDTILIAPEIKRGEGAQLFKQVAILAITVVAAYYLGPSGVGLKGLALGGSIAAISIGTTLLLNSLIPPVPLPGMGGLGSTSFESSQMYTITSQSNGVKKYGSVPKVYGTHRIFPIICATPYTELDSDRDTKAIIQYYNAVYDFGYGPLEISDIKIGNTPIANFDDCDFELVDFKRPPTDQGPWDEDLLQDLELYKGVFAKEDIAYALNRNRTDSNPIESEYKVVRFSSPNQDSKQEIILDFICPEGLIAYATNGTTYNRNIDLKIRFRKVGTTTWRNFNDNTWVARHSSKGADNTVYRDRFLTLRPFPASINSYDLVKTTEGVYDRIPSGVTIPTTWTKGRKWWVTEEYGYKKGKTFIEAAPGLAVVGSHIYFQGKSIGRVTSIVNPTSSYARYNLQSPLKNNIIFYARTRVYDKKDKTGAVISFPGYAYPSRSEYQPRPDRKLYVNLLSAGEVIVSDKTTQQKYFSVRFEPRETGVFEIEVERVRSYSTASFQRLDKLTLISITTRFLRNGLQTPFNSTSIGQAPISTDYRHVFMDLRIRATNQINGAVQNLSAVATSILEVYDPITQTWSLQPTDNPAWVFVDLLTGPINPKRISKDRLHMESILEWAEFCDETPQSGPVEFRAKRFSCNFVLDFDTTLQSAINLVCNAAQASLNIVDGKYGVLIDKNREIPVQIFTPRNSWGFSSTRNYSEPPDALKVKFVSPFKEWEVDEVVVYSDGYNLSNATTFEEVNTFACTNSEQAWRYGRFMLASAKLRQETINITVDFENIVCTRGDYVLVTQDAMKVGGRPARVKSLVGDRITIDDGIDTTPVPYGYIFRGVGGIQQGTLTVVDSDEFDLIGPYPSVGDLIIIGPIDTIKYECIVKAITPNDELSATLTLIEKAPAIYDADFLEELPDYDAQISTALDPDLAPPPPVEDLEVIENTWRVMGNEYQYYITIDWEVVTGTAYETFEIYVDNGAGYDLKAFTKETIYEYIVDQRNLGVEHFFKVLGVSATGKKISLIEAPFVSATPERKISPPSDVEALFINITNQVIQLEWPRITDVDLKEYLLRYTPQVLGATWESSIPFARVSGITNTISVQGRTGTYFVKALDLNNNESLRAAQAITSIPNLFDLNVISETNDFPSLPGEKVTIEFDGAGIVLKKLSDGGPTTNQYYPDGFYYYSEFLDLGEIYTVRLQSAIEAEGFTVDDLMSNWIRLSDVLALANAGNASWDVETYYRGTDTFNVMSEWLTLSSIDPLSEGSQDNWTEWKKFIMGDFTARIFQFRLKLISYVPSVTPRVFNGVIKADMPDRFEAYNNLMSSATETTKIIYTPPFKGPGTTPNIQITQDNSQSGDYFVISNKSLNGFEIIFYDVNDNQVERQFDASVRGFGRKALKVI